MNLPTATANLRCPQCHDETICAQNKAFVTQRIYLNDDGRINYEAWGTEDVEMDGPEWYVCRSCGDHAEDVAYFKAKPPTDDDLRKLAKDRYSSDEIEIDGNAKVSRGDDPGAFVAAWVWVPFPEENQ